MLIKRKLSPSWWRGNVIKISPTNLADVIREIFPRGSEPPPPTGSRFPWIFFFQASPFSKLFSIFQVFSIFSRGGEIHVARRRLGRSAFRIETRVPWIVKGQRVFPRWNWGRICGARLIRDMFLTPARARTLAKTHTDTRTHQRCTERGHRHTRTRWRGARCSAALRRVFRCHSCIANVRESAREDVRLTRSPGTWVVRLYLGTKRDLSILSKKCAKKVTRWFVLNLLLYSELVFSQRERKKLFDRRDSILQFFNPCC